MDALPGLAPDLRPSIVAGPLLGSDDGVEPSTVRVKLVRRWLYAEDCGVTVEPIPLDGNPFPPGTRMHHWLNIDWKIRLFILTDDIDTETGQSEPPPQLNDLAKALLNESDDALSELFQGAKEVVFSVGDDGGYHFSPIGWVLDPNEFRQRLRPMVNVVYEDYNAAKWAAMMSALLDVPVVPNSRADIPALNKLFSDAMNDGMDFRDEHGKKVRRRPSELVSSLTEGIRKVPQPAEFGGLLEQLETARSANAKAKTAIERLDTAINEISTLLLRPSRNENALQECLTRNPAFFGPSYSRVIPKHRLGAEYVTDYALELSDGSIDVVEIEASTHALYTSAGNPTSALVHAEQQVLDWLAWLDKNSPYARANLPGVRRANGIVVIGTRASLNESDSERLRWRNIVFGGRITVLTYDDLVARCQALRSLLSEEMNDAAT